MNFFKNPLKSVSSQLVKLSSLGLMAFVSSVGALFAEETAAAGGSNPDIIKWLALGAPIALGLAAMGVGLGQGRAVASAMEGISRNPQSSKDLFVPMILGLVFMEALVIFTLIFVFVFKNAVL